MDQALVWPCERFDRYYPQEAEFGATHEDHAGSSLVLS